MVTSPIHKSFNNAILTIVAKSSPYSKNAVLLLEAIRQDPEANLQELLSQVFNGVITVQATLLRYQINKSPISIDTLPAFLSIPFVYNLAEKIYNSYLTQGDTIAVLLEKLITVINKALTSYSDEQLSEIFPAFTKSELENLEVITSSLNNWSTDSLLTSESVRYDNQPII